MGGSGEGAGLCLGAIMCLDMYAGADERSGVVWGLQLCGGAQLKPLLRKAARTWYVKRSGYTAKEVPRVK